MLCEVHFNEQNLKVFELQTRLLVIFACKKLKYKKVYNLKYYKVYEVNSE